MATRIFLPRSILLELQIFNDSIGIRLKNAVHLGKKFLAAIFSIIAYSKPIEENNDQDNMDSVFDGLQDGSKHVCSIDGLRFSNLMTSQLQSKP